jgi:alpha-galactosidase
MPRITMIGAGSIVFAKRMISDVLSYPELDGSAIALMDIDQHRLDLTSRLARRMAVQAGRRVDVTATLDRREALEGADYVMNMIQVGGLDAYEKDIAIPQRYGVEQCVGDTLGPGGIFRAVRTFPVLQAIVRDMEELCPGALLLNFSNPMAINVWALSEITALRTVGLCHNVNLTAERLARWVGVPFPELDLWVGGINHMVWFLKLEHRGQDVYPRLRAAMQDPEIYAEDPVRFDLMRHFGYFVSESSGHLSEYVPYFRKRPDLLQGLVESFTAPDADWLDWGRTGGYLRTCHRRRDELDQRLLAQLEGREPVSLGSSGWDAVPIIHGLETGTPHRIFGNVKNTGLISNLPEGCCVEVPCLVDGTGVHACQVGALPAQLAALCRTNVNVQELTVQALLTGDRAALRYAAKLDPLTGAVCSLEEIDHMVDELDAAMAPWRDGATPRPALTATC